MPAPQETESVVSWVIVWKQGGREATAHECDPLEELPRRLRFDPTLVGPLSNDFKHLRLVEAERFAFDRRRPVLEALRVMRVSKLDTDE